MRPHERLPESVTYKGKRYRLDMSYVAFFTVFALMQDKSVLDYVKVDGALDILVKGRHPVDPELLSAIYDLIKEDRPRSGSDQKLMDIEQDWGYICAAFQQAYGIDLYKNRKMHIIRFRSLLQALPKDTRMSEIIGIRAAEIPAPTKYNRERIAELTRLKAQYALRGSEDSLQDGFAKLFALLKARAKNA